MSYNPNSTRKRPRENEEDDNSHRYCPPQKRHENNSAPDHSRQHHGDQYHGLGVIYQGAASASRSPEASAVETALESLMFEEMDARYFTIDASLAPSSCRWLLDREEYKRWQDIGSISEHHGFLWIKGKAGAGKSTLMKFAFNHAEKTRHQDQIVVSFFFNARGAPIEKSLIGMYRALLYQILHKIPRLRHLLCKKRTLSAQTQDWSLGVLRSVFQDVIENLALDHLICYVDALNECTEDNVEKMVSLFEDLGESSVMRGTRFHVCFASRHYPHITIERSENLILEDQDGHKADIFSYTKKKLKISNKALKGEVSKQIEDRASGVFLWVVLVVSILNDECSRGNVQMIRTRLAEIPTGLTDLIQDILDRDKPTKYLVPLLQWVLFSRRPLSPEELFLALQSIEPETLRDSHASEALARDNIDKFVLNTSKGLAEMTKGKKPKVQFIHELVRTHLLGSEGLVKLEPQLQTHLVGQSHDKLKMCCYNYLTSDSCTHAAFPTVLPNANSPDGKQLRYQTLDTLPFLQYALENVLHHANLAHVGSIDQHGFLETFPFDTWSRLGNAIARFTSHRHTETVSQAYLLAEQGCAALLAMVMKSRPNPDEPKERCRSILGAAVDSRNIESVRVILAHDGYEHSFGKDNTLCMTLARTSGESEIVQAPVAAKAPVSRRREHEVYSSNVNNLRSNHPGSAYELRVQWKGLEVKLSLRFAHTLASFVRDVSDRRQLSKGFSAQARQFLRYFSIMLKSQAVGIEETTARRFIRSQRKLISNLILRPTEHADEASKKHRAKIRPDSADPYAELENMDSKRSDFDLINQWLGTLETDEQQRVSALLLSSHALEEDADPSHTQQDYNSSIETKSDNDPDPRASEPDIVSMQEFLVGNSCWDWLKCRVEVQTRVTSWPIFCMERVAQTFYDMPSSGNNRDFFRARFVVSWHPRSFLRTQFADNNQWKLGNIIALTGSNGIVQACTCSEYLRMMWPMTEDELLQVLEEDLQIVSETGTSHTMTNGCNVQVAPDNERPDCLVIQVHAPVPYLIDIAEQLTWLGEALSASDQPQTICRRCASCTLGSLGKSADDYTTFCITYSTEVYDSNENARCWENLFSNPSIACDFPAMSRDHEEPGMEMTLDVMITLGELVSTTSFNNRYMLRGFSSAFYPTKNLEIGSSMTWNFVCREDKSYLPCLEASLGSIETSATFDESWLRSTRHFVGWTPESFYNMGMKATDYTRITQPVTTKDGSNLVLKQLTFGFSRHITASATVARGKHHQGIFCDSTGPYKRMIRQAQMGRVVLYDTSERRAWLADGATALLHLLCCKLTAQYTPIVSYRDVTKQFRYADPNDPNASASVLCNELNRNLVLDEESNYRVEDEIRNIFERLQELVKAHNKNSEDWAIRMTDRARLEGYSFRNIVDDVSLLSPKMVYLKESSGDWIKLVHDTKAVVLMAQGFGELISSRKTICPNWRTVPIEKDYLVAKISLLYDIAASEGREKDFPFWLTHNTRWHGVGAVFEPCHGSCQRSSDVCCARAQEIRPCKFITGLASPRLGEEYTEGAVVFGRDLRMPTVSRVLQKVRRSVSSPPGPVRPAGRVDPSIATARKSTESEIPSKQIGDLRVLPSSGSIHNELPHVHSQGESSSMGQMELDSTNDCASTPWPTESEEEQRPGTPSTKDLSASEVSVRLKRSASESPDRRTAALQRKRGRTNLRGQLARTPQSTEEDDGFEGTCITFETSSTCDQDCTLGL